MIVPEKWWQRPVTSTSPTLHTLACTCCHITAARLHHSALTHAILHSCITPLPTQHLGHKSGHYISTTNLTISLLQISINRGFCSILLLHEIYHPNITACILNTCQNSKICYTVNTSLLASLVYFLKSPSIYPITHLTYLLHPFFHKHVHASNPFELHCWNCHSF